MLRWPWWSPFGSIYVKVIWTWVLEVSRQETDIMVICVVGSSLRCMWRVAPCRERLGWLDLWEDWCKTLEKKGRGVSFRDRAKEWGWRELFGCKLDMEQRGGESLWVPLFPNSSPLQSILHTVTTGVYHLTILKVFTAPCFSQIKIKYLNIVKSRFNRPFSSSSVTQPVWISSPSDWVVSTSWMATFRAFCSC